ncbi:RNA-directed RNA polymerase [ssRNA phage SRR7976301_5]|uniref:RNA-directed RNA polymerase n=1 Tax=ssRNA phage SRR7976301_5 TaxID=2786666 RepID=A0A8S5L197_9VIRU|nr:RNA-directed RNA polymerase [ssRNA phage SRR7976301_5]DAD51117.1 TPA_asm: RNA-directed RNA polymerase [ssRNA phage SRR7976301_5]
MKSLISFDEQFSFEKSVSILTRLCRHLLPPNHHLLTLVMNQDWKALTNYQVDYTTILDQSEAKLVRQVLAFFQKNAMLPLGVDRKAVARAKFASAERSCRVMNWRILNRRFDPERGFDTNFLAKVQWKIRSILGPAPTWSELSYGFGPGANVGTLLRQTSARSKMSCQPTYTANAAELVEFMRGEFPHWDYLQSPPKITNYGKLSFVPKDAKTDRSIETQPIVNSFLQKGVGSAIRSRLALHGCDLRHGQEANAAAAKLGSLNDELATIDLASASDTISYMLVMELLPPDWFSLLDTVRTPFVRDTLQKSEDFLQKFSGMGCAYTFELETLIFLAICEVVSGEKCLVYGDDMVVPSKAAPAIIHRLEACGFEVNTSKSYISGRFRESCGKDFFDGVDIRPCYVKDRLSYKELFRLHNFFFRRNQAYMADVCRKFIPERLKRITGPDGFGDGHLLCLNPVMRPHGRKNGWGGWTFRTYATNPRTVRYSMRGDYASILLKLRDSLPATDLTVAASYRRGKWYRANDSIARTMYHERGNEGYSLKRIYTLGI